MIKKRSYSRSYGMYNVVAALNEMMKRSYEGRPVYLHVIFKFIFFYFFKKMVGLFPNKNKRAALVKYLEM